MTEIGSARVAFFAALEKFGRPAGVVFQEIEGVPELLVFRAEEQRGAAVYGVEVGVDQAALASKSPAELGLRAANELLRLVHEGLPRVQGTAYERVIIALTP